MPTLGDVLELREQELFVDRNEELRIFESWLSREDEPPEILAVVGPGGIGKSVLLRAFGRAAGRQGRGWHLIDGRTFDGTHNELLRLLSGRHPEDAIEAINASRPLIMFDTFGRLDRLTRFLQQEFLPRLAQDVKVVFASRHEFGPAWRHWEDMIRTIPLSGFSEDASRKYLRVRKIPREQASKVLSVAGGHPLALSLAADLAGRGIERSVAEQPEWTLAIRTLVRGLIEDSTDPKLRALIKAATVVRQFDEETLAFVSGQTDTRDAFSELCRLSFVRSGAQGLRLHDDVRRIIEQDLRLQEPALLQDMRDRARRYYAGRLRTDRPGKADWLLGEVVALLESDVMTEVYYRDEPFEVWAEELLSHDPAEVLEVHRAFVAGLPGLPSAPPAEELDPAFVEAAVRYPGTRTDVARDEYGPIGYGIALPICGETMRFIPPGGAIDRLIEEALGAARSSLPESWEEAGITYLSAVAFSGRNIEGAIAVLPRRGWWLLLQGGMFLASGGSPRAAAALEMMGFTRIPGIGRTPVGDQALDGFVLDMSRVGVEGWIELIGTGRKASIAPRGPELERPVQEALLHWSRDEALERSPLVKLALPMGPGSGVAPADAVRAMLREALERARSRGGRDSARAFDALRLAYIDKSGSHDEAAERLHVSRTTFFRLLKRAVHELAENT